MVLMLTPTATRVSYLPSLNDGVGGAGGGSMTIMVLNEAGHRVTVAKRLRAGGGGGACERLRQTWSSEGKGWTTLCDVYFVCWEGVMAHPI